MQSTSWAANWFAASQEIPCISRNPKVHYRTHKRPPPVSILGQNNPIKASHPTSLTLIPLTWRIWWAHNSANKLQMGFNGAFKGLRSILIYPFHPHLVLPSGLFPSRLLTKTLYAPLLSPFRGTCPTHQIFLNPLTPNDPHRLRTAPLTSKRCILYIYSTNIDT